MSAFQIFTQPSQQALDTAANVLSGATLTFTLTGTSTPTNAYSDSTLSTPTANPLSANAAGVWIPVFLDPTITYRVVLKTAAGAVLQTWDPANESLLTQELIGRLLYPRTLTEISASVTVVSYAYPEGYVDRYGTNTAPDTTNMTAAIQAALDVAHAKGTGGNVYFLPATYRTTSAVAVNLNSVRIHIHGNGAVMHCDHNGNGIDWLVTNENFSYHIIENLVIKGPNTFLPAGGYVPPSTGVGINLNRNLTTNAVTGYNNVLRDVTVQGFLYGMDMQAVIGLNVFGSFFEFNQYGVRIAGGQTNANHFFGTHIRYNRQRGLTSDGTTGGSLSNATANTFSGCLFESNLPYPFVSGGTPPGDSVAIYLANSYDFIFEDCYSENHSASIYLTTSSKGNQFLRHRVSGGTGRVDQIVLDGASVNSNTFDIKQAGAQTAAEIHIVANSGAQLYNRFSGEGLNFIAGSLTAVLDYSDIKPSQNYSPSFGVGLIRMPSQGYQSNVSQGTNPGQISTIGGATSTLYLGGIGEQQIANGLTANTTITTFSGLVPYSIFTITMATAAFGLSIVSGTGAAAIVLQNQLSVTLTKVGQQITFYVNGAGLAHEIGRNFSARSLGTASITGAGTTQAVTFAGAGLFNQPDTSYKVDFWVESITGTPATGSWDAFAASRTTSGFTLTTAVAPGVGNTVNFGFEVIRLDS